MMTLQQIAAVIGGEISGEPQTVLQRATSLADARTGDITYVDGKKNTLAWAQCPAAAAVVSPTFIATDERPLIRVGRPLAAFLKLLLHLRGERSTPPGIHPTAIVDGTAKLGTNVSIGPRAVVGADTVVGDGTAIHAGAIVGQHCVLGIDNIIHANSVIHDDCKFGARVIIHSGCVIGAEGYGYTQQQGQHIRIPQLGDVILEDDVEVGANSTIDRGTIGPTRVGTGTKIDNLVMIAHNCQIGKHNLIVAQVGLAGSCVTGDYVILAGQVGVTDHTTIGSRAILAAKSGVFGDIPAGAHWMGYPAMNARDYLRAVAGSKKVQELRDEIKALKKQVEALQAPA